MDRKYYIYGIAAVLALFLVVLRLNKGGQTINFTPGRTIVQPNTELQALNAQLSTSENIARYQNETSRVLGVLGYLGLLDTNEKTFALGSKQADVDLEKSKLGFKTASELGLAAFQTERYKAEREAFAFIESQRYQYEQTRQQEKTKRNQSVWDTIGSIASGIFKFL